MSKGTSLPYKRVLLKLSGRVFGTEKQGLDFNEVCKVASIIKNVHRKTGVQIAIVIGAGNLFRGRYVDGTKIDHVVADQIGMLGTVMNALALQEEMERLGNSTRVMSSISIPTVCELFIRRRALRHMEKGRIVILAGGTGNPYFTTDSAAALRAIELKCAVLLKASDIDDIYDKDPKKFPDAKKIGKVDYQTALEKGLKVMDSTAFALCQSRKMPIIIFNFERRENLEKIIEGESIGTLISDNPTT
ncbi:UMP kinase [Candidatus Roizmanbacteria bacterium RIFCSPHIGHO2_02_FULL_37_15]|uniref:Uridylate kinase n=1 Tax=Candidatus Roizmanbacteria bacterium RIFCSPLOWO2_01_FULL_37_16 TaxID=1802058 RepID=A0A1F7IQ47_9BACT|nr:MAG: UMP kinase [Candidatus Roizmanbacteria bacterium RIFCSPHIGHO2_01_FULL_37_16b]OGK20367.1 MAG: UMP kinase [Candidatus Roizmanbacteria bacterium RIFCSPHIGHO2_02_FULL_37_15]OGK34191.1 MAG: UMP kinase [Candidatus Roizmanbacteria bacterium RIFCSPHIGHO2_12_FULL_36_11]OGK45489.1 MAG: UMP kinase [Candidatus Roizmanbacteria bacterium RIFCSPLOWO2_01_FULL_37_16]OGK55696.1 MAG: UMP kinase [Candidatus Roizmanbacteria bacterium RIFCSPLOWO2_02_FULL_37_9]